MSSSTQNHAESFRNYLKKSVLDPKRAKLNYNSDFSHVRTYSWLHQLRNTQGKICGTYLGNIYRIHNIHKYLWYKIIRNTGAAFGGRPTGSVFLIFCIVNIYGYPLYIPHISHISFLNMFHIFPSYVSIYFLAMILLFFYIYIYIYIS